MRVAQAAKGGSVDGLRFDQLSRRLAGFGSRRGALKAIAGAVVATVAGGRAVEAQSCTAQYRPCQSDGQCCAGAVCQSGLCQPGCKIDGVFRSASTPQPGNTCARCTPAVSTTAWSPANEGMSCWSGNLCGGASTCQAGACQPTNPTPCQPLTACHAAGECNPNTGLCSNPPAEAGTPCGGGEQCIGGFHTPGLMCNGSGACSGGQTVSCAPYGCGDTACRTRCDADSECAAGAVCRESECVYLRANGESCPADHHCVSGHCVEGICCDTACESRCELCGTGTCRPKECGGGTECSTGVCNPASGECEYPVDAGRCLIGGICYDAGDANPANPCERCDPAGTPIAWGARPVGAVCGEVVCTDGNAMWPACDGAGSCSSVAGQGCSPYGCNAAGDGCGTSCADSADCVNGAACVSGACAQTIQGALTNQTTTGRCAVGGGVNSSARDLYTIIHAGGPVQIGLRGTFGGGGSLFDPLLQIYTTFNPADVCANQVAFDDDGGCNFDALITLGDLSAGTYTVVATGVSGGLGTYTLTFGLGAAC